LQWVVCDIVNTPVCVFRNVLRFVAVCSLLQRVAVVYSVVF